MIKENDVDISVRLRPMTMQGREGKSVSRFVNLITRFTTVAL